MIKKVVEVYLLPGCLLETGMADKTREEEKRKEEGGDIRVKRAVGKMVGHALLLARR